MVYNVPWHYYRSFDIESKFDKVRTRVTHYYDYWTDIHPSSESQFKNQRFLAGINPWYGSWMESRSVDERNGVTRKQYRIGFSDVTYPWLSALSSGNESRSLGSGTWSFSRNMSRLYR